LYFNPNIADDFTVDKPYASVDPEMKFNQQVAGGEGEGPQGV